MDAGAERQFPAAKRRKDPVADLRRSGLFVALDLRVVPPVFDVPAAICCCREECFGNAGPLDILEVRDVLTLEFRKRGVEETRSVRLDGAQVHVAMPPLPFGSKGGVEEGIDLFLRGNPGGRHPDGFVHEQAQRFAVHHLFRPDSWRLGHLGRWWRRRGRRRRRSGRCRARVVVASTGQEPGQRQWEPEHSEPAPCGRVQWSRTSLRSIVGVLAGSADPVLDDGHLHDKTLFSGTPAGAGHPEQESRGGTKAGLSFSHGEAAPVMTPET